MGQFESDDIFYIWIYYINKFDSVCGEFAADVVLQFVPWMLDG